MKRFIPLLIASTCFGQTADKASVSGSVVSSTGEPLRRATVHLAEIPKLAQGLSAETDSQGNFSFTDIAPGRYTLFADRRGYLSARYSDSRGSILELAPGQSATGISLKMFPQGIIAGRVVDEDGDPVPDASVNLIPPSGAFATTNADGAFAIGNLGPQRYFISATAPLSQSLPGGLRMPAKQSDHAAYVPIYYPESIDLADASPIELTPGLQVRGLEIRLRKVPVFQVSGKVINSVTHGPGSSPSVVLMRKQTMPGPLDSRTSAVNEGSFQFDDVLPGNYILQATPDGMSGPTPMVGRTLVSVGNGDVDGVVLEMKPALQITGRVIVEGNPLQTGPNIALLPEEGINYQSEFAEVAPDGTFSLSGLEPAPYRAAVNNLRPPYFVKSVRYAGHDALKEAFDVSTTGSLDIVISDKMSMVTGVVHDSSGAPVAGAMVAVLPTQNPNSARITDQNGHFQFPVIPGEHRIIAILDPAFGMPFVRAENIGTPFKVDEGATLTLDVPLLTPDQAQITFR